MRLLTAALTAAALSLSVAEAQLPVSLIATAATQQREVLLSGEFSGFEGHSGEGTARILREDGRLVLEFDGFRTDRGPQLEVWIAEDSVTSNAEGKAASRITLGRLQGARVASQRYELPADLDLGAVGSIVIWCRAFGVLFASADLS